MKNPIFKETRVWYDRNPGFGEQFLGLMRMLLALLLLLMFVLLGGDFFQNVYARDLALQAREISPLLHLIPVDFIAFVIYIFTWEKFTLRPAGIRRHGFGDHCRGILRQGYL